MADKDSKTLEQIANSIDALHTAFETSFKELRVEFKELRDELDEVKVRLVYLEHDPRNRSTLRPASRGINAEGVEGAGQDDYFEPWP